MQEIRIKVPRFLAKMPKQKQQPLIMRGLRKAAKEKLAELEEEIEQGKTAIESYEKKYGMTLEEFKKSDPQGWEEHEDIIDWDAWVEAMEQDQKTVEELHQWLTPIE